MTKQMRQKIESNEPNQRFSLINGYRNVEIKSYDSIRQEETVGDWFVRMLKKPKGIWFESTG